MKQNVKEKTSIAMVPLEAEDTYLAKHEEMNALSEETFSERPCLVDSVIGGQTAYFNAAVNISECIFL